MADNKLGLGIIAYEGTEMIAEIVTEIRDLVDYVVIGFQEFSYTGDKCDPNDKREVEKLKEEGLVDEVLIIDTNHTDFPRVQETEKRNTLLDNMIAMGCTHELIIDSDEFYPHDSFERAKKKIYDMDIEMSYCRYVNYFHDYTHYLKYPFKDGQYVPFISKVQYRFAWNCTDFPFPSDPTRRFVRPKGPVLDEKGNQLYDKIKNKDGKIEEKPRMKYLVDFYLFPWKELKMHHLSWLRANIRKKMNAWSSKSYFENYLEIIDKSAERFERFNDDNINEGAFLLFNTPGNQIDIVKFKRQYIFPKVDYHTRVNDEAYDRVIRFCHYPNASLARMIDVLDENIVNEEYKDHNNSPKLRPKRDFDYLVFSTDEITGEIKDAIIDFINHRQNDSEIFIFDYKDIKDIVILNFESILKIRKYVQMEWNIYNNYADGIRTTMRKYCEKNNLTYEKYIKTIEVK